MCKICSMVFNVFGANKQTRYDKIQSRCPVMIKRLMV